MTDIQTRDAPINLRALPSQRTLLDHAAAVRGKSRTDFILEAACEAAENVLLDQRFFQLDDAAFEKFEQALNAPVTENPAIRKLVATKAPWER